jgi:hypothetical protein
MAGDELLFRPNRPPTPPLAEAHREEVPLLRRHRRWTRFSHADRPNQMDLNR